MDRKLLNINGIPTIVMCDSTEKLADVLRHQAGLTGTKVACGQGQCGCCSVILNGKVVRSCTTTMKRVPAESEITTIEGIGTPDKLHALQLAWILHGGAQCGYCSPGFIVSSKALLDQNPDPTREEIRDWWQKHANVCRCTGYKPLVDAVIDAAKVLRGEMSEDELVYKVPEDGHIWNTRFPRPSAIAKVTGTLDYGADLELKMPPGTLHCAVVHAQVSHANVLSIDVSEAEKMPGVFKVVTHKDVKGRNRINGLVMYPDDVKADGWERPILCDTKVFQYGDALAIVCADTIEQALRGRAQGQGRARGAAGLHERPRRHGRRRHRDLPRHAQHVLHPAAHQGRGHRGHLRRRRRTWPKASTTCSASRTSTSSPTAALPTPTTRVA